MIVGLAEFRSSVLAPANRLLGDSVARSNCLQELERVEMSDQTHNTARKVWVEPEIRDLDVGETNAFISRGADVGGNPTIDCQRS